MSARNVSATLSETVIAGGYCVGCGACAVAKDSPFTMRMTPQGRYLPIKTATTVETPSLGAICPFFNHGENEDTLVPDNFRAGANHHEDIGWYRALFAGHALEAPFREHGSSGGLTNWLAAELLKTGRIDGVLHVRPAPPGNEANALFEYALSTDISALNHGAKSKYYPIELSQVVRLVGDHPGRYAFIGVPCFVKAIRLLSRKDHKLASAIKFTFALFCGHLKSRGFAEYNAWQLGIRPENLTGFDFREKLADRPANRYGVRATGVVGDELTSKAAPTSDLRGSDWGEGYFRLKACDYCDDIVGEVADISFGDAWLPKYVLESKGTNIVIVRNEELRQLLADAERTNRVKLTPVSVDEVHESQESNYRHRREGLAYRLSVQDAAGLWRPEKRVASCDSHISDARKRVFNIRIQIAELSHRFFLTAKKSRDITIFDHLIHSFTTAYKKAQQEDLRTQSAHTAPAKTKVKFRALVYYRRRILAELQKALRSIRQSRKRAVILPPTTPGSLGDDAMVSATIMWLRKNGFEKVALMQHAEVTSLRFSSSPDEIIPIWEFMPPQPKISAFDVIGGMQNYDYFFVLGADVLDGYYSDIESYHRLLLAQTAAQCGFRVTLLGFSYNATPAPLALQAMRQLRPPVRICPRDPVSYERLTRLIQSPPIQVADVAFLLEPMEPADQAVTCWLEDQRKRGVPLIGINAILTSRFFADRSAQSLDSYLSFYQDLIREISDRFTESRFLFIPHDYRPNGVGEGPVLEQIYQSLDDDLQRRVLKLEGHYTASEIKWIVSQLDFVVSSRMHLAIAAIGQGVPTFCFEYQGKFRGLFEAIEQNQLLSSISEILDTPGEVKNRVINCIQNRDALKNQISAKLPDLMKLAERNFDF